MSLIEIIKNRFESLSSSHKSVANYVLQNYNEIAFYTLGKLAKEIGVSTTTVIRFANELGFDGYSAMQATIQANIKAQMSLPERLENIKESKKQNGLLEDIFDNDIKNIKATLSLVNKKELQNVINLILNSNKIFVLGFKGSFSVAHFFWTILSQIKENAYLIHGTGNTFFEDIIHVKEDDVCIVCMFPRYLKEMIDLLEDIKKRKTKIVLITSQFHEEVKIYADYIIPCSIKGISYKYSIVSAMSIVNYIAAAIAEENQKEALEVSSRIEEMISEKIKP